MTLPTSVNKTGLYLQQQLTKYIPNFYTVDYSELWGLDPTLNYHRAVPDLPLGLKQIEYWTKDNLGQIPTLYDGYGDDIPVVDVEIGNNTVKAGMFTLATEWNLLQLEQERVAASMGSMIPSINLVAAKQDSLADFFNRGDHHLSLYGYPKAGIRGIFSIPGINNIDSSFQPYKKASGAYTLTTAQLYTDLVSLIRIFVSRARLSSPAMVQMKVPPILGERLQEFYQVSGSTVLLTLKQLLSSPDVGMGVARIDICNELQGAELNKYVYNESGSGFYSTGNDRIVFKATSYTPERHYYPRRLYPAYQVNTLKYEQVSIGASTGIINVKPEKMFYYDFNNTLV